MIDAPPGWYPDPTHRHQLRYWDGAQWTDQVASAGVRWTDPVLAEPTNRRDGRRHSSRHLGTIGIVLCILAVAAVAVPAVSFARATSADGVLLEDAVRVKVELPADKTYGIFVDDANNSGYSEQCSAYDSDGDEIQLADPPATLSGSETESLDLVFNTGSGSLTISCSVPGEHVALRPVPNSRALLLGILGALLMGTAGVGLVIAWLVTRTRGRS